MTPVGAEKGPDLLCGRSGPLHMPWTVRGQAPEGAAYAFRFVL